MTTLTLFLGGGEVIDMLLFLNFWWGYICLTGTLNMRGYDANRVGWPWISGQGSME